MKKCVLSGLLCALLMLLTLALIANTYNGNSLKEYEHIDYVSSITSENCFVCSEH